MPGDIHNGAIGTLKISGKTRQRSGKNTLFRAATCTNDRIFEAARIGGRM
jgi:hypothetical protein